MKKLKLEDLHFDDTEILSRSQLKNVLGGSGGSVYCTAVAFNCPSVSCSCPVDGSNSYSCNPGTDFVTCVCGIAPNVTTLMC
nr:hypothetical protein [uncultured Dyadobacter sp.]